jgi:hypothetical protein
MEVVLIGGQFQGMVDCVIFSSFFTSLDAIWVGNPLLA